MNNLCRDVWRPQNLARLTVLGFEWVTPAVLQEIRRNLRLSKVTQGKNMTNTLGTECSRRSYNCNKAKHIMKL